jgi:hypothetical protein
MCNVQLLRDSERQINIKTTTGEVYASDWYVETNTRSQATNTEAGSKAVETVMREFSINGDDVEEIFLNRKKEEGTIYITDHAEGRLKQRNGWNKNTAIRMIKKVYDEGTRAEDVKGYLAPWFRHKTEEGNPGDEFVLYGDMVYLFNGQSLLTAFHKPHKGKFLSK